ncbi:hypothetical protein K4F52_002685 [Lecanicillium sp. MT-2017a]|nr:hypothetical protein K4F52_002685 [Lecanicillium sp. MT-2017a]
MLQQQRHRRTEEYTDPENTDNDSEDEDIYDPDQPVEQRRRVQKSFRDLLRNLTENTEEYLQTGSHGLHETILKANELSKQVRQTTEATIDSRLLVSTTDLSYRKTLRLTQGSLSQGIDVDEFVSKCVTYMRRENGAMGDTESDAIPTQSQRANNSTQFADDDDAAGDAGDMMNWRHMGTDACLPHIRRPALPGLLLGPLSVERKLRKTIKRSAPFRPHNLTETRPEVLNVDDVAKRDNDLTAICGKILQRLQKIQEDTQEAVFAAIEDDMDDEEKMRIMHKHGLRSTGGIDFIKFVVNPNSFGQTVENIFYVSFLIRDGRVEVDYDESDLPTLAPVAREIPSEEESRQALSKHQAILSIDMQTWRDAVRTLKITDSMIENRQETAHSAPGTKGWYN